MNRKILVYGIMMMLIITSFIMISHAHEYKDNTHKLRKIQQAIQEQNAQWTADFNTIFTTQEENIHSLTGLIMEDIYTNEYVKYETTNPPTDSFDWRNINGKNYITPVKHQSGCGSCTAFATIAALEASVLIEYDEIFDCDLSEAHLFFCGGGECGGGMFINTAFEFVRDTGVVDELCFPYKPVNMDCDEKAPNWANRLVTVTTKGRVIEETDIKRAIIDYGPVVTGLTVFEDLQAYTGGIYEHVWGDTVGPHSICIIGYNDDPGYWICKNSWGKGWGEDGFFRIKYGECGIAYDAYFMRGVNGNIQPYKPTNIFPVDGTENSDLDITITWENGDIDNDEVTYSIFFNEGYSTDMNNDPIAEGITSTYFNIEGLEIATQYSFRILAEDEHGSQHLSDEVTFTTRSLVPPLIDGPTESRKQTDCTYTASTIEVNGDIYYWFFDWGDGDTSGWIGPYGPNDTVSATHSWQKPGNYSINVRYSQDGVISEWGTLKVSMQKTKIFIDPFIRFLENHPRLFPILTLLLT